MPIVARALPLIRPITDMRTKFNEVCEQATEEQEPIVLTKNGVASYLFMDKETYEAEQRRNRFYLALREAEIEEKYRPESLGAAESDKRMGEVFAAMGLEYAGA